MVFRSVCWYVCGTMTLHPLDDDDTIMRAMHLQNVLDQLTFYSQQDLEIFKSRIQACLNEELRMVALCGASQGDPSFMSGSATELIEQIDEQQKNSISRHITELLNRISLVCSARIHLACVSVLF